MNINIEANKKKQFVNLSEFTKSCIKYAEIKV